MYFNKMKKKKNGKFGEPGTEWIVLKNKIKSKSNQQKLIYSISFSLSHQNQHSEACARFIMTFGIYEHGYFMISNDSH